MTSTNVQTPTAYLTPRAAADYLAISASMLAKLRVCGDGPTYSKIGRTVRYARRDLDSWMVAQSRCATSNVPPRIAANPRIRVAPKNDVVTLPGAPREWSIRK